MRLDLPSPQPGQRAGRNRGNRIETGGPATYNLRRSLHARPPARDRDLRRYNRERVENRLEMRRAGQPGGRGDAVMDAARGVRVDRLRGRDRGSGGLEFLRKDITPELARDAFRLTREAGIRTLGYFLLGIPGETMEDELETARFAIGIGADYAQFGILLTSPGTALYELAAEKGWLHGGPGARTGRAAARVAR
ncbi:MAG: hypothetical protein MZV64_34575 [Ignavibacteriales bacterium]|nr:hypothetical protein [Ignavibacteriales bacterium]